MTTKFAAYRESYRTNPDAFLEGVVSFCKRASDDDRSLLERMFPWVLGLGGAYGAMLLGDAWGRHANAHGIKLGPVRGPVVTMLNKALPKEKQFDLSGGAKPATGKNG